MGVTYFAYGANIARSVMAEYCPRHRLLGIAELVDHQLAFRRRSVRTGTGVADILPRAGRSVWGVLYELDEAEFAQLDRKEGAGWAYDRWAVEVRQPGADEPIRAVAYRVKRPESVEVPPAPEYVNGLIGAAKARGLPRGYVRGLQEAARRAGTIVEQIRDS